MLESDSTTVVDMLQRAIREGNGCANWFANWSLYWEVRLHLVNSPAYKLASCLLRDMVETFIPRAVSSF